MKQNIPNPYSSSIDPNKTKKCDCENKTGPKPFSSQNTPNSNKTN